MEGWDTLHHEPLIFLTRQKLYILKKLGHILLNNVYIICYSYVLFFYITSPSAGNKTNYINVCLLEKQSLLSEAFVM